MMGYDRAELKRSVKRSMKGSGCMMVTLLLTVVVSAGTWIINTVLGWLTPGQLGLSTMISFHLQAGYELEEAVKQAILKLLSLGPGPLVSVIAVGAVTSIVAALWQSAMEVGYEGWCLDMVRDAHPPVGRIFCALPRFVPVLLTRLLTGLFELLWTIPVFVGYVLVISTALFLRIPVLSILLIQVGVVGLVLGIVWVTLRYALVDYVLLDKGLSGMDAIRESKRLMKDNKGRAFGLLLSFAGWYVLMVVMVYVGLFLAILPLIGMYVSGGGTGGWVAASGFALVVLVVLSIGTSILSLWLKPYVTGAMAKFYDWTNGRLDGPQGGSGYGGWSAPGDYTWNSGSSGPGTGSGSGGGYPPPPPKPPRSPREDPWD